MLAKRLPSILPPLTLQEALETTKIHSVAGKLGPDAQLISKRPYRSPHHTISDVELMLNEGYISLISLMMMVLIYIHQIMNSFIYRMIIF